MKSEQFRRSDFAEHRHTTFDVVLQETTLTLELRDVRASGSDPTSEHTFSLLFRGPGDRYLEQKTYHVIHPEMGQLDIFLVPVSRDEQGRYYEAVFNNAPAVRRYEGS